MPASLNAFQFITGTVSYVLLGALIYYLLVTKPLIEKENKQQKFIGGLKRGDDVMTSGGLLGKVQQVLPDHVVIEIAAGTKVKVHLKHVEVVPGSSTAAVIESDDQKGKQKKA